MSGTLMEIMDPSLSSLAPRDQMMKCIQIGLLCVQNDPMDRPMMSMVNVMLTSNMVTQCSIEAGVLYLEGWCKLGHVPIFSVCKQIAYVAERGFNNRT
jgi:hypothetical protein